MSRLSGLAAFDKARSPWVWAVPSLAVCLMALLWLGEGNRALFLVINGFGDQANAGFWANVTVLGDSLVIFTLALLFVGRYPRLVWALIIAAVIGTFVVHGFKEWLNLNRPPAVFSLDEIHVIGTAHRAVSFPSGHTTAVFALVGLIALQRDIALSVKWALILWASLVGLSRIVVGVHWPTDVLGGAAIGWLSAAAGLWLAPRIGWGLTPRAQRLFSMLLVGAALALIFFHDSGYPQARTLEILIALAALTVALPGVRRVFRMVADEEEERPPVSSPGAAPTVSRWPGAILRLGVTVLIFVLIFRSIDLPSVVDVLRGVVPRLLGLALFFQFLSTALASYRWHLVMRPLGYPMPFLFYLKSYFKGSFFNQGLPTSIGGDAIRVLDVAREGYRKRDAFYGVFVDRVLGLVGLLILNSVANAVEPDLLPWGVFVTINLLVGLGLAGFLLFALARRLQWLRRWRLLTPLHTASERLSGVLATPRQLFAQFSLSIAVHLLSLVAIFLIGRSVGMEFGLGTFMIIVPPVILLTLIPVSLAGWGVRESAMVGLFTLIGADQAAVLSMSILYGVVLIVSSLPGFYLYLGGRHRA